jgi:hypothetical protein
MLLDWKKVSQDQHTNLLYPYVTRIEGACFGGGKTSSCCFVVDENLIFPRRDEVCDCWRR